MPNKTFRNFQLSEEMCHKITKFLHMELAEKYGLLTCTHVELSEDNRYAKAWISIYPPRPQKDDIDVVIRPVKNELIKHLKKNIPIKYFPHIDFIVDTSADTMAKLDKELDEIKQTK